MTPFKKNSLAGAFSFRQRWVKGNCIRLQHNGIERPAYHWEQRFRFVDFEKSLGRAFDDYLKETEQSEISTKSEIAALQNVFPKKLDLIPVAGTKSIAARIVGLYFLFDNNELVYVGKSDTCVRARILAHQRRKIQFNKIAIAKIPTVYESVFIGAFNPKYNSQHITYLHQRKHLHTHINTLLSNSLEFKVPPPKCDLGTNYIKMYCWGDKYIYYPIS